MEFRNEDDDVDDDDVSTLLSARAKCAARRSATSRWAVLRLFTEVSLLFTGAAAAGEEEEEEEEEES